MSSLASVDFVPSLVTEPPFFITGSGRCGTTLLRRLILERTDTVIPPENYATQVTQRLWEEADGDWPGFVVAVLRVMTQNRKNWSTYGLDVATLARRLADAPPPSRRPEMVWHLFAEAYAERIGRRDYVRWGDKTPSNADHLPALARLFPQAQYVFLVRDPLDVALSYGRMEGREGRFMEGAERWVRTNAAILAFIQDRRSQIALFRYEDLAAESEKLVAEVLAFLRLPAHAPRPVDDMLTDAAAFRHLNNVFKPVTTESIGRGHEGLDAATRTAILERTRGLRAVFGY